MPTAIPPPFRRRAPAIRILLGLALLTGDAPLHAGAPAFTTIHEALRQPCSSRFWIERKGGKHTMGDPQSFFSHTLDLDELTFDIGNGASLANINRSGTVKLLTLPRDCYRGTCDATRGHWPGVWTGRDSSSHGPYAFQIEIDGRKENLASVKWDLRTGLLDNIFPLTELRDPKGRFVVRLITFAPVSADGGLRLRGIVCGLEIESLADAPLRGVVHLPRPFADERKQGSLSWTQFDAFDFEVGLADAPAFSWTVPFDLARGGTAWVPAVLYAPGEAVVEQINGRGSLGWLRESWSYYRGVLGRLETPGEPWLAEFGERQILQCLQDVALSPSGRMSGANIGTYPPTRQIWTKDAYYSCLPLMALEPSLARKAILWFDEFGMRHKGEVVAGGVGHSISLTVAAPLLAALYYDQTGDRAFFAEHPHLRGKWDAMFRELVATRQNSDVWLFPTRYISDGPVKSEWHCGSNVAVWRALKGFARLLAEVHGDAASAAEYDAMAGRVREALLARTVIAGPFGPQFIEGVNRDGVVPAMTSDGEESETTLMPFYGFLDYAEPAYRNYMRFSMSPHNAQYNPVFRSINWEGIVPATAPGFNKGVCGADDAEALFGEQGYVTEIRRVTDTDGSVPWWPVAGKERGQVRRSYPFKSGWFAGVFTQVFIHRLLGIRYDAPRADFRFTPLAATGDFAWRDFPMGADRFSVGVREGVVTFTNGAGRPVTFTAPPAAPIVVAPGQTVDVRPGVR